MLKIEFTISNAPDAARAARIASAIAAEYEDVAGADTTTPVTASTPRRGRPPKPDPVAAYIGAGGTLPTIQETPTPAAPVVRETAAPAIPDNPHAPPAPPVDPADAVVFARDEALARVRAEAQERGATWLREVLTAAKAGKLSELTDDQLAGIMAALNAAAAKVAA